MIEERLQRIDEATFRQVNLSADKKPTLCWHRCYRQVSFFVKEPQVIHELTVNDIDFFPETKEASKQVKASPDSKIIIKGTAEEFETKIYVAKKCAEDEGKDIFSFSKPSGGIHIHFMSAEKARSTKDFREGAFTGTMHYFDDEDMEDLLQLVCSIPTEHTKYLAEILEKNRDYGLAVRIGLLSFGSEVEDALREGWMSQDLFICDHAQAPILRIEACQPNILKEKD